MSESLIISGFGVIGTEVLHEIIKKNKSKKLQISIIDKDYTNFPGGIAYSTSKSKFGFFNNPLRLSNNEFQNWVKKPSNQKKLITYFEDNKDLNLSNWLKKNIIKNKYKFKNLSELYLPRLTYSIFLEDKISKTFKFIKKKNLLKLIFLKINY